MLLARQRLLLTLLDAIGEPATHTDFQKLLFLYTRECEAGPSYDFVPYKYGAFSFTSYADKRKLMVHGLLAKDDENWVLTEEGRREARRRGIESPEVARFVRRHSQLRGDALISEQYRQHPYYATRSEILDRLQLDSETEARIAAARTHPGPAGLVTIGYEGRTLERYLNELLWDGVTLLCDVRRNPLSRKYGFSRLTLKNACEGVGMRYLHLPELGVPSEYRKDLHTQADYDALFVVYERETLPQQRGALDEIAARIAAGERVALTCFERLPERCHRHCVAEALERSGGVGLKPRHL